MTSFDLANAGVGASDSTFAMVAGGATALAATARRVSKFDAGAGSAAAAAVGACWTSCSPCVETD